MHNTMTGDVVLFAFVVIQIVVGALVIHSKNPYKVALLVVHVILSLFIILGLGSGIYVDLRDIATGKMFSTISLFAAGVALLLNLIIGVRLLTLKAFKPKLVLAHKITAYVLAVFLIARIIFDIVKI